MSERREVPEVLVCPQCGEPCSVVQIDSVTVIAEVRCPNGHVRDRFLQPDAGDMERACQVERHLSEEGGADLMLDWRYKAGREDGYREARARYERESAQIVRNRPKPSPP